MTTTIANDDQQGQGLGDYWSESERPLASLVFVLPLLAAYELGVLVMGPEAVRNGADVWLRQLLQLLGFGQYFLLPLLTVGILLGWHHTTRRPWRLSRGVIRGMTCECVLLAPCLWVIYQLLDTFSAGPEVAPVPAAIMTGVPEVIRQAIGFLGAGVYEELLFRLILLMGVVWLIRRAGISHRIAIASAVVITSLLFAAAHHLGASGEPWLWFAFRFRFFAGIFIGLLFVYRGFGIAAGTHAGYDILVGLF